ncbi:DEAD/DEAH box helicase [Dermabacter vaginalis]|uniref:DEAD/DEAH box helicase n=1 Tax=Dermabacter vaginalis TaxID=1630135 RepID=UPI001EF7209D|nr:DEAD/DEAH box helicase [Dermabacter vaginalis]MCG7442774.1 DEAD/DEAH box helicase [Dermabacter vaginalis]
MTTDSTDRTETALENREEIAEALEMDGMAAPSPDSAEDAPSADSTDAPNATDAPEVSHDDERVRFDELGLPPELLAAVRDLGFTHPSPIQERAIPALLEGRSVLGVAQTGTGKTAAFGLPLLAEVRASNRATQGLVLAPTRELAMQVAEAIQSFATKLDGVNVVSVYGGAPYGPQERALARGAHVIVGTPGRVIDHLKRGNIVLDHLSTLVLDEADEMLRMGFAEDVDEILGFAPQKKRMALFSATMPPAIKRVAEEHMPDAVSVAVARQSTTVTSVEQTYAVVPFRHKTGALTRIVETTDADATIVFVRTRSAAEEVGTALVARGIVAATISGDVPQKERERIVERLRDGSLTVLVATDVAARGLDVERIGLVVNFDIPSEPEAYVHRIGRTGRAGRTGKALTFVAPHEKRKLRNIERTTRQELEEIHIPSPLDVSRHKMKKVLAEVPGRLEKGRLNLYFDLLNEFLAENNVSVEQVAAALGAMTVGDDGPRAHEDDFTGASFRDKGERGKGKDRNERRDRGEKRPRRSSAGFTTYRIAVGKNHGVRPQSIVGAIAGEGGLNGQDVGKIDLFPSFSLVELRDGVDEAALARIGRARVGGKPMRIQVDQGPKKGGKFKARKGKHVDDRGAKKSNRW